MTGKNDPLRNLGIRSSTSPPLVVSSRSRAPLRSVVRVSLRSYRAAPICSVASASISSCNAIRTDSRIRSTPSPARNASSSSDRADWGRAIGGLLFDVCLAVHTEDLADGPLTYGTPPSYPKPHHSTQCQSHPVGAMLMVVLLARSTTLCPGDGGLVPSCGQQHDRDRPAWLDRSVAPPQLR